jgi:hypothetical protein
MCALSALEQASELHASNAIRKKGALRSPYSSCAQLQGARAQARSSTKTETMASQLPRSLAAHNTPGPFWGGAPASAPAPAPTPTPPPPPAPKTQQPLRLDPSLKRLHDELVAQKADPSILKDWTTEKRKDGPNRGDRVYYVDPNGKAHRSAPAARRAILQTGPVTPPKKRKTQDKDRSQLVKWKLSGCTVAVYCVEINQCDGCTLH